MSSSSSSSLAKNRSAWANGRYDGGSAFGGTQPRLLPLGKKALVTPRPSNSSSTTKQPKSKQVSLKAAFKRQQDPAPRPPTQKSTSKENRPPSQRALADGRSSSDDDSLLGAKESRTAEPRGFFGRFYKAFAHSNDDDTSPSSAAFSRQQSQPRPSKGIGKRILNPSASEKRRGPTVDFDASGEPPMDDSELDGETQRRKRKRVQGGGRGQLDLVPADDFEGFGGRTQSTSSSSKKRVKRTLEMGAEEKPVVLELENDNDEELVQRPREEEHQEEDSWEPEPSTRPDSLPVPTAPSHDLSKRSYAESSQSDDETLQQQLVPQRDDPSDVLVPDSDVLVPDSDDLVPDSEDEHMYGTDDECDRLMRSVGGMADDSGYAEMEAEPEKETQEYHHLSLPMLPPSLSSVDNRRLTVPSAPIAKVVQVVHNSESPFPPLSAERSIGRTPSAILMPPPPLPRSRSSGSSSGEKVDIANTPSPTEAITIAKKTPTDTPPASPIVLVPDTQTQLDYRPIPAPPSLLSPNRVLCEETQFHPLPAAPVIPSGSAKASLIASTSKLSPRSPTTPKRDTAITAAQSISGWNSLASAWAGQRPASPPKPLSPRQSRLNEFFRIPSRPALNLEEDDEETQFVEDSQPSAPAGFTSLTGSLTFEQMEAFRGAFHTTREMGRLARNGSKADLEDVPEEEEIEEAMVGDRIESSDNEECWSPLCSPVKRRFPTLALGVGEGAQKAIFGGGGGSQGRGRQASASQFRSGSQEQRQSQEQSSSAEQRGAEQLAQLETQWESYWSEETYQPFVPLRESL